LNFAECGIAECGKTLRCNLRNVPQRKFRKIHLTKIPHSAFRKVHLPAFMTFSVVVLWGCGHIYGMPVSGESKNTAEKCVYFMQYGRIK